MKFSKSITFLLAISSIIAISICCSKKRIAAPTLNSYDSPNSYLDSKQQAEQEFEITSSGGGPIIGNQGTKIWTGKQCLMFPNGDSVIWPFKIKLVELYTPKDMIYYRMPTVAGGNILETDGEIRLRAFKGTSELVIKPGGCNVQIEMPNANAKNYMRVHYGFNAADWTDNPSSLGISTSLNPLFSATTYGYLADIAKLGWINCGINASTSSASNLTFSSAVDDLTNVSIFVYVSGKKTVMQVSNLISGQIPNGSSIKIIAIGLGSGGQLYSFNQNLTINSNTPIDVTMAATTDASLTALLNSL
ncbi:MAG: hypothetical protein ACK504_07685 [Bacteroidota bacterium]